MGPILVLAKNSPPFVASSGHLIGPTLNFNAQGSGHGRLLLLLQRISVKVRSSPRSNFASPATTLFLSASGKVLDKLAVSLFLFRDVIDIKGASY